MSYCGQPSVLDYFSFSNPQDPIRAVVCPFTQGAGIPPSLVSLVVFGTVGIALTLRVQHPAPILVAGILTGGIAAQNAPGQSVNILALAIFVGLSGLGIYLYARAKGTL